MRLSKQLIFLIGIPLACEIAFVSTLATALSQAERDFVKESRNREIALCVNRLMRDLLQAAMSIGTRYLSKDDSNLAYVETALLDIAKQRLRLKSLITRDFEQYPQYLDFDKGIENNLLTVDQFHELMDSHNDLEGIKALARIKNLVSLINKTGAVILDKQEKLSQKYRRDQTFYRQRIRNIIIFGALANVLAAGLLGWFVLRRTLERFNVLMQNNKRLALGEKLAAPLKGDDELAELDQTFHQMVATLAEAKQRDRDFVSTISHDIRSPLSGLKLSVELFATGAFGELNSKGTTVLAKSERSIQRILDITGNLLELGKIESGTYIPQLELTKLASLFEESVSLVQSLADSKDVRVEVVDVDIELRLDASQIVRVLMNLLSNAIKFSEPEQVVVLLASSDGDYVRVEVMDSGRGVPADKQNSIFDRYKQSEASDGHDRKGVGLGLSICKAIVQAHGGTIGVSARSTGGSIFWFQLPIRPS